ncbi:MAG: type IX secretion system membrane protein PorP/SprF [Cytophagaceae bacterium]
MKKIIFILTLFLYSAGYCQNSPMLSQYMFNRLILNPAYAGSNEHLSLSILNRSQWMGINKAPNTQLISLDALAGKNVGLGLNFVKDHTGVTNQTDVLGSLSYRVGGTGFSFGLRGGFAYYQANLSNAFVWDPTDPVFSTNTKSTLLPKFGFGMYYSNGLFYAGLSAPDLLVYDQNKLFTSPDGKVSSLKKNYILTGGYTYLLNEKIEIEPSMLVKYHPTSPLAVNLNCNVKFSEKFLAGISYRMNTALTGLVQIKIMEKVKAGYAFDIYQPNIKLSYLGTHELMLSYNLGIE